MPDLITLEVIDADGAVREAADDVGATRGDFFKRAGIAGAGLVAGGVLIDGLASPADARIRRRRSKANDVRILNYALTLEYLEAAFYAQANASGAIIEPTVKRFAEITGAHEAAHVAVLQDVLGSAAVKKPKFDFRDTVTDAAKFMVTAQALEDTGVAAYAKQGPNILQREVVVAALAIHSVEARHAAWIRFLNSGGVGGESKLPAPKAFDRARGEKATLETVGATGFIVG